MTETAELSTLHLTLEQLRSCVRDVRGRYGDTPHVRRLLLDLERLDIDIAELSTVTPHGEPIRPAMQRIDDTPADPNMWLGVDDEGLGGYHGGRDQ